VGDKVSEETHYYISSLPLSAGAKKVAHAIRSHWSVENNLHWCMDVAFNEDACRVRKDKGPANLLSYAPSNQLCSGSPPVPNTSGLQAGFNLQKASSPFTLP
jgi:predicted transposase YbfD/YdcC